MCWGSVGDLLGMGGSWRVLGGEGVGGDIEALSACKSQ